MVIFGDRSGGNDNDDDGDDDEDCCGPDYTTFTHHGILQKWLTALSNSSDSRWKDKIVFVKHCKNKGLALITEPDTWYCIFLLGFLYGVQ